MHLEEAKFVLNLVLWTVILELDYDRTAIVSRHDSPVTVQDKTGSDYNKIYTTGSRIGRGR